MASDGTNRHDTAAAPANTTEQLTRVTRARNQKNVALERNTALGCAVTCSAILSQILSLGRADGALTLALYACAVTIPVSIASSVISETYMAAGQNIIEFANTRTADLIESVLWIASFLGVFVAVAACFYHLDAVVFHVFIVSIVLAFLLFSLHAHSMALWYDRRTKKPDRGQET